MAAPERSAYAYLGTSQFAVGVLDGLIARGVPPALVVAPPDRPRGRGRSLAPPPVAARAGELGLPLLQSGDVNEPGARAALREAGGLAMVCAFGQLIREPLLSDVEFLNVHPSLLPRWRGAAPIERAIMAGDERTGVAIIRIVAELDAGPVALMDELEIEPGEDFGSLAARLSRLGGELAARALIERAGGEIALAPQAAEGVTYAEKIDPGERRLDPSLEAISLERAVRALTPHIGAYLELAGGERLGVTRATAGPAGPAEGELDEADGALRLGCARGSLRIERVKPAGKREMAAADFLRGHGVPALA